jgi:hypothetical protein
MVHFLSKLGRWLFTVALCLFLGIHLVRGQTPSGRAVDVVLYAAIALGVFLLALEPVGRVVAFFRGGAKLVLVKVDNLAFEATNTNLPSGLVDVISILVRNGREAGGDLATAHDVTATIQAFDANGDEFQTSAPTAHGRWIPVEGPPLWMMDVLGSNRRVTVPPTQEEARLACLATYLRSDDDAHAGQSFLFRDTYLETLGWPGMAPGKWKLVVALRGRNLRRPARFEFDLVSDASFDHASLTPRKPWWRRWKD